MKHNSDIMSKHVVDDIKTWTVKNNKRKCATTCHVKWVNKRSFEKKKIIILQSNITQMYKGI